MATGIGKNGRSGRSKPGRGAQGGGNGDASAGAGPASEVRGGRNTTIEVEAFEAEAHSKGEDGFGLDDDPLQPEDLLDDPEATGGEDSDPFHQRTAVFDKGEFLGELSDLEDRPPDTRAAVNAEAGLAPRGFRLIVVKGAELGVEWAFKQAEIVIGRDDDCALVLTDIAVSRRHARIVQEDAQFVLHDLGSGNGTFLNGLSIDVKPLSSGDEITIGERTLRFVELNDAPATAAAFPARETGNGEASAAGSAKSRARGEDAKPGSKVGSGQRPGALGASGAASGLGAGLGSIVPGSGDGQGASASAARSADGSLAPEALAALVEAGSGLEADLGPPRGAALRSVLMLLGTFVLVGAVGFSIWRFVEGRQAEARLAEASHRARVEFLQAIELVKVRRFGDAALLLARVRSVQPDYDRAKEYLTHCESELKVWKALESARTLEQGGRLSEALRAVEAIAADSAYADDVAEIRERILRDQVASMLTEARLRFQTADTEGAESLVERALEKVPSHEGARALKRAIAKEVKLKARSRARKLGPPPLPRALESARALYLRGKRAAAMDAARAVGTPAASTFAEQVARVDVLLSRAAAGSAKKDAASILDVVPEAIDLDQKLGGGGGVVRGELIRHYVNGLYLRGVEAYYQEDYAEAFDRFSQVLRYQPDQKFAETWIADLSSKAKELYWQGFAMKDSDRSQAEALFQRVRSMTEPTNPYYKLASRWLVAAPEDAASKPISPRMEGQGAEDGERP